jgi:hypothetical protein
MALVVNDRVKETSTTTGTGTLTLAGAVTGFETFSSAIGNGNTTYYAIVANNGAFEVGLGTVSAGALARTTIISSSNSDSAVSLPSGTKDVFCTQPASKSVILDASGNIVANNASNLTALNATQLTSGTVNNARLPTPISDKVINASRPLTVKGDGSSADGQLILNCSQNSHGVKITSPAHSANATWEWILPVNDGTSGQVLTTDGNSQAQLSWTSPEVGDITAVTAGTNLTGGGTSGDVTLNLADASTSAKGAASFSSDNFAASSGAITIKDAGVATAEIQNDAVTQAKIADDAVGADQLASSAVVTASIVDDNITQAKIADDAVGADQLAASAVVTDSIVDSNVTTAKVADNAITLAKMASGTDGNIISYDASGNPVAVATGSSGQVLTSAGAGAVPSFQTPTVGDITAVTAGTNLTGGGSSGDVTLNLADASTSAKGAASFSSDNFAASSGAITIKDSGVASAEIQDNAVTLAKMASGTDGNIISYDASGNPVAIATGSSGQVLTSAGAGAQPSFQTPTVGDITSVVAGTNLTGGGTSGDVTLNLADASTSAKGAASFSSDNFAASSGAITIKNAGVATAEIQDSAVTTAKIADSNVTLAKMAANSVDSNQYVDGSIDTAHIANSQITNALMADNAIDTAEIAASAVETAKINDSAVTTAKINNDAVTLAKMAPGTDGNLITYDTSGNPAAVATGNSGQVLTSAGAGAVPSFQTIAAAAITSTANGANNRIATYSDADSLNGEANLTFDGSTLTVTGAIVPGANDTYDLGASGNVWRDIYTGDLHLTNEAKSEGNAVDGTKGNWTIQEGEESLFILNNKSGKKYRFKLEEM